MENLEGKVAFITGGASGIGLGIARAFLKNGMMVTIADVRQDHLDDAMNLLKENGRRVHAIRLDVADRAAMEQAAVEVERVYGKIHLLCNNAGVNILRPLDEATYEDWDWVLSVNLGGVINGLQTFIPRLKSHGEGAHIVNTSSIAGIAAGPATGIYSASKFAIRGLSEALRCDLARYRIRVSVLCPGTVATNLHESEQIRPEKYTGGPDSALRRKRAESGEHLGKVLPSGMDPLEVGEKVVLGVKRNDFYIFSHPEHREEFQESFDEIIAALPMEEADPRRLEFERFRRQRKIDALKG